MSWDDAEENAEAGREVAAMEAALRSRNTLESLGTSERTHLMFPAKDGVYGFPQHGSSTNQYGINSSGQVTGSNGEVTMPLPLMAPITSFGQQQQDHQHEISIQSQQQVAKLQQTVAIASHCSQHPQQQFVAHNATNFAHLFAHQAGNSAHQPCNSANQQHCVQLPTLEQIQQQQIQPLPPQQQQLQLPFTSDANTFLQQLQFAQLQQQIQAAQQQQMPNAIQQQLQLHFSQAQAASTSNVALAPAPVTQAPPHPPPKKQPTASDGIKTSSLRALPKVKSDSSAEFAMISTVSASDTDGEISRRLKSKRQASYDPSNFNDEPFDMSNMTEQEKVKVNRDRNREHARNTRLRKKAYLEKLKVTVDDLCRERDLLVTERASAANLLIEMHNTRTEVLMSFFALRTSNEKRRKLWSSILDESCFTCVMPVTPYRSFSASEVQLSKCQRTIMGIDGMMADTSSLHVLFDTLVDRETFPRSKINFRYTLVTEEAVVSGNQVMARWVMTTTNAVQCGSKTEVTKQGMLCCKFNSAYKIFALELMFDVMAFMLQLKQSAGSDGFSVVPNTVQTCQRSFDKPMVMTLADPPYTIIQVNELWTNMTGFTAEEVVGKVSCSILHSSDEDNTSLKNMMNEIRYKRPASAMLVNKTKSGESFSNFLVVFPLSTDSRICYYIGLTMHDKKGQCLESVQAQVASTPSLQPNHNTVCSSISEQARQVATSVMQLSVVSEGMDDPSFQVKAAVDKSPPSSLNSTSTLNEVQHSGTVHEDQKRPEGAISASSLLPR